MTRAQLIPFLILLSARGPLLCAQSEAVARPAQSIARRIPVSLVAVSSSSAPAVGARSARIYRADARSGDVIEVDAATATPRLVATAALLLTMMHEARGDRIDRIAPILVRDDAFPMSLTAHDVQAAGALLTRARQASQRGVLPARVRFFIPNRDLRDDMRKSGRLRMAQRSRAEKAVAHEAHSR